MRYYAMMRDGLRADPFNADAILTELGGRDHPREGYESVLSMPAAAPEPWLAERAGVPRGNVEQHTFASPSLGNSRRAWVYTPPGYTPTDHLPSLILLDGRSFRWMVPTPTIMDNLIADGVVPPMVVCMLDNPTPVSRLTEYECNAAFADALADEVAPWLRAAYGTTALAQRSIIGGVSYGGLASGFAAHARPGVVGNVLSLSGSYWWGPSEAGAEWLAQQVAQAPVTPVRWYLDAGSLERTPIPVAGANMVAVSRHLRDVLVARGAKVTFNIFGGGHEFCCWRQSLADGLQWLTATWR
jgi:enterochelin esterase family protein